MRGINITNSWTAVSEGNPSCPSHQRDSSTVCSHDDSDLWLDHQEWNHTTSSIHSWESHGQNLVIMNVCDWLYQELEKQRENYGNQERKKYLIESVLESERTQWLGTQMNRHCGIRGETPEQYWIWEQSWVHYAAPFQGTFTFHFPPTFQNRLQKSWLVWQAWGT